MIEASEIVAFLTATLVLNLTPGSDVLFIASQCLGTEGRRRILAALGVSLGIVFHIFALALGLSELLIYYPLTFHILKIGGVVYLIFLAYSTFKGSDASVNVESQTYSSSAKIFWRGILTNVLNPKVALFFLAFIPQFLHPKMEDVFLQTVTLGALFFVSGTTVNIGYALLFSYASSRINSSSRFQAWTSRLTGVVFLGLACKLLLTEKRA